MKNFSLLCWVPSISNYIRLNELTFEQLSNISKFILNNDDEGLSEYFENVVKNNLLEKEIYNILTKFDKWFILTFLRANNISPSLILKATDPFDKECTYEVNLFDILTIATEFIPIFNFEIKMDILNVKIELPKTIYTKEDSLLHLSHLFFNNKETTISNLSINEKITLFKELSVNILPVIKNIINIKEKENNKLKLLPVNTELKNIYEISLNMFDNTLFEYLKFIFLSYSKNVYLKKYFLINKIGLSMNEVHSITPFEGDIFINLYNQDNTDKNKDKI